VCPSGAFDAVSKTCDESCDDGFYFNYADQTCEECAYGCEKCKDMDTCYDCKWPLVLNNAGHILEDSVNECVCASVTLQKYYESGDLTGLDADETKRLFKLCEVKKNTHCDGSSTNAYGNSYEWKNYYRYGVGSYSISYGYTDEYFFEHPYHGCSPIEMLYACKKGSMDGICTECITGFTLGDDLVCMPTLAGDAGYNWTTNAAYFDAHEAHSNLYTFGPFDENSSSVDWRSKGVITPVQDYTLVGNTPVTKCNVSYAAAAADLASAAWSIKTGIANFKPSIQMIIDCETEISDGCTTGSLTSALGAFATLGAYDATVWPYTGVDTANCHLFETEKIPYTHMSKFKLE